MSECRDLVFVVPTLLPPGSKVLVEVWEEGPVRVKLKPDEEAFFGSSVWGPPLEPVIDTEAE